MSGPSNLPTTPDAPAPKAAGEVGFSRVGRMIARRTTDLIAIGILAIGGLMVGGRLSEWWSTKPEDAASPAEIAALESGSTGTWGLFGAPVTLQFGNSAQSLRRQSLRGTRENAADALRKWCRETVQNSDLPPAAPDAGERGLLERLQRMGPATEVPGYGRIYETDRPMLMVLGVRVPASGEAEPGENRAPGRGESAAASGRVVCWGFAFPDEPGIWTLYLSAGGKAEERGALLPDIPLPAGSRRILSVRNDGGDALVGFSGSGEPAAWRRVFDDWFRAQGWSPARNWSEAGGRLSARFASPIKDVPEVGWHGTVDVQITRDGDSGLSGLLNFLPRERSEK